MALIEKAKGRRQNQSPSGYTRLFGNEALGNLMSRVQAAVISSGTELEKLILERSNRVPNLDDFLEKNVHSQSEGIWVASKRQVKQSKIIRSKHEPDILAFDLDDRVSYVIEVKDGDQFDTKKASGEHASLHEFATDVSLVVPFSIRVYMCCFNVGDLNAVYNGLKRQFSMNEVLTGKGLCDLLRVNFQEICAARNAEQEDNIDYLIEQLVRIPSVRDKITKRL